MSPTAIYIWGHYFSPARRSDVYPLMLLLSAPRHLGRLVVV